MSAAEFGVVHVCVENFEHVVAATGGLWQDEISKKKTCKENSLLWFYISYIMLLTILKSEEKQWTLLKQALLC